MALYAGRNSNDLVANIRVASTGANVTDAVVTAVVYHENGSQVTSASLSYQSEDEYRGTITSILTVGVLYKVIATASNYSWERVRYERAIEPVA